MHTRVEEGEKKSDERGERDHGRLREKESERDCGTEGEQSGERG